VRLLDFPQLHLNTPRIYKHVLSSGLLCFQLNLVANATTTYEHLMSYGASQFSRGTWQVKMRVFADSEQKYEDAV
jgi:hypothetical protein